MLISVLEPVFKNSNLSKNNIEFNEYSCQFYTNEASSDFYILLDKENLSLEDLQSLKGQGINQLDEIIKEHEASNEAYEKNATLILCVNCDEGLQNENIINQIEEDKYLFKKNILFYTSSEVDDLHTLFDGQYTQEKANKIMRTEECFDAIKENRVCGYALLPRLFIKLPFLSLQSHQIDLENLSTIILEETSNQNNKALYNIISNLVIDVSQISSFNDLKSLGLIEEQIDEQI